MTLVCFLSLESGGGRKQGRSSCYDDSRSDVACRRIFCGTHPLTRRAGAKPQHDHWPAAVCCPVDRGMLSPTEFDRVRAVECQEERVTIAILEKVHAHHSPKYTPKVRDTTSLVLQNIVHACISIRSVYKYFVVLRFFITAQILFPLPPAFQNSRSPSGIVPAVGWRQ